MPEILKSGINGLDGILKGGFRRGVSILIAGPPGVGKTIMALQFIYYGAKDYKENGIFITTEEGVNDIRDYANGLGIKIEKYEKSNAIFLSEKSVSTLKGGIASIDGLLNLIKKKKIKRIALDSLIFFNYLYPKINQNEIEFRREVLMFIQQLKNAGVTFLGIAERNYTSIDNIHYDSLDFIFDAIIIASRIRKGAYFEKVITVLKIRGQEHSTDIYPMMIGNGGVRILTEQTPFSLLDKEDKRQDDRE